MNAQEIREKANTLGTAIKALVKQFEDETDTTVTNLAIARGQEITSEKRQEPLYIQVGVKVL